MRSANEDPILNLDHSTLISHGLASLRPSCYFPPCSLSFRSLASLIPIMEASSSLWPAAALPFSLTAAELRFALVGELDSRRPPYSYIITGWCELRSGSGAGGPLVNSSTCHCHPPFRMLSLRLSLCSAPGRRFMRIPPRVLVSVGLGLLRPFSRLMLLPHCLLALCLGVVVWFTEESQEARAVSLIWIYINELSSSVW
jgi:hypothetical protein